MGRRCPTGSCWQCFLVPSSAWFSGGGRSLSLDTFGGLGGPSGEALVNGRRDGLAQSGALSTAVIDQTHSSAYTINTLIDAYLTSSDFTKRPRVNTGLVSPLPADAVEPKHVLALMET